MSIDPTSISTEDLLAIQSAVQNELTRRYGFDPRRSYEDGREFYWARVGDELVYALTPEGVRWGVAYFQSEDDEGLGEPEPDWYSTPVVSDVPVNEGKLVAYEVGYRDVDHWYMWLDRMRRVVDEEGT